MVDANFIANFVQAFLWQEYDNPTPLVTFHYEAWELVTAIDKYVALAAPRGHSKSTSITFAYVLVEVLFRLRDFPVIVGNTYDAACKFLATIRDALLYNEALNDAFGILPETEWDKDTENEIIVVCKDGHKFCIHATGIEQYSRGIKWIHKRPDLVMLDDVEDDEQVLSKERREKLSSKLLSTIMPSGSDDVIFRCVGTILHMDSLLQHMVESTTWKSAVYEAHNDDFSFILWPEKFPEVELRRIRDGYIEQGKLEKYNMEYRNKPVDTANGFFRESDLLPMRDSDWLEIQNQRCRIIVGADFAWTQKQKSDYTVFVVGAINSIGEIMIVDVIRMRMDARMQEENIFSIEFTYTLWNNNRPLEWFPEEGAISKTLQLSLEKEMEKRDRYLIINHISPGTKDKRQRAGPFQARCRARKVRVNKEADWYPAFETEFLRFDRGVHDDQVDAAALLAIGLSKIALPETVEEEEEEVWLFKKQQTHVGEGRNPVTGY